MSSTKGGQAHEATVNVHDLRIRDLVDLVAAQVSSAEDSIQQMYAWHFERSMSAARFLVGLAVSILIAMIAAVLSKEVDVKAWQVVLIAVGAIVKGFYGVYLYHGVRLIHRQYVATLHLLNALQRIKPFIIRYRYRN